MSIPTTKIAVDRYPTEMEIHLISMHMPQLKFWIVHGYPLMIEAETINKADIEKFKSILKSACLIK